MISTQRTEVEVIVKTVAPSISPPEKDRTGHLAGSMAVAVALSVMLWSHNVWGAAGELYETGAPDLGTASAGRAAMAADASTVASNPAGMTLLDRTQLMGALGALLPSSNFDLAPQTTTSGGGGGNAGVFTPLGSFFYVYKLSERLRVGMGAYSDYGLSTDPGKQWAGRYYYTAVSLVSSKANPSLAYEVNKWLSVGVGFSFGVARLGLQSKINTLRPKNPDGGYSLESWDEAFGGNVGILLRPIDKLRVGLTYKSPEDYKFGFRPHVTGTGPVVTAIRRRIGGVKVNVPLPEPQQVMASALYQITPEFSLMGNVGWQNWLTWSEFPVGVSSANIQKNPIANLHFSDTCQIAVGQQYRIVEKWQWSAGFAYDSAPVSKANRMALLPIDRQLRYGTGIQYEINPDTTAGLAVELLDAGPGPFSATKSRLAGTLQGHDSTNLLTIVAANIIWKF